MNHLAWIGNPPKHWRVVKLRQILRPFSEKNHPELPLLSVVREKGVIVRNVEDKEENHNYVPEDLSGYKRVKRGQFAMNKMKAWQGSYGVSKYDGIVSPAYFVFDINYDINHDFFNAAIRSKAYVSYFGQASDGIRVGQWDLSMQRMKEIPFLVPPRDEQEQIMRLLDWKVSAINRLINIKRNQITQIEELKKAIIHKAVTKGLHDVPMKNSGISWMGIIPEHWEVEKIKRHFYIENGSDPSLPGDIPVYGSGDSSFKRCGEYKNGPTVLLGRKGATLNIPHYIEGKYWNVDTAFNVVAKSECQVFMKFFYYLAGMFDYNFYIKQTTLPSMKQSDYGNMRIAIPPQAEQKQILVYIEKQNENLEKAIAYINAFVKSLTDLKARLISDVVTGKIDVRGVEVPEYETVEEEAGADMDEEACE